MEVAEFGSLNEVARTDQRIDVVPTSKPDLTDFESAVPLLCDLAVLHDVDGNAAAPGFAAASLPLFL